MRRSRSRDLDAGRGGQRKFQHPKGAGKRQGGNSEKQFPKEKLPKGNFCSKAGMELCQQNDVSSTLSWRSSCNSRLPAATHREGLGVTHGLSSAFQLCNIWGGCGELGVRACVHPPPQLPAHSNSGFQELLAQS